MQTLTALELDALTEIFNLGVGQAAAALSQLAGEPVLLDVPSVLWLKPQQLLQQMQQEGDQRISAVCQHYRGELQTDAVLMFPAAQSLQLVQIMVADDVALEDLGEMEQEALAEIGNIVLNAVVASLGQSLQLAFDGSLPEVSVGLGSEVLPLQDQSSHEVLCINIRFHIASRDLQGSLAFLLDVPSIDVLQSRIADFLTSLHQP